MLRPMRVHFVAVAGTGMGALAGLFKAAGHDVTGSDVAFYPPMGPALERWGIRLMTGFDPAHLEPRPDLCVVGNVCRPWNPEAVAAREAGIPTTTMAHALADHILTVIRALHELSAIPVTPARHLWRMIVYIINLAANCARPAPREPPHQLILIDHKMHDQRIGLEPPPQNFVQLFRLRQSARKTVQDEAIATIRARNPLLNHA